MKSSNQLIIPPIEGGNTVNFIATGESGRIQLEGSGDIVMQVGVDGVNFATVEHDVEFSNGVAIAPCEFYVGDYVRISATSITKAIINFSMVEFNERN